MKKILALTSVLAATVLSTMAQGTLNGNNAGVTLLLVQDPLVNGGTAVAVGKAANNAGFGAGEGPGKITIEMFAAANGTSLATLEGSSPVMTISNSPSALANASGTFAFGNPYTLPTATAFNGSGSIEVILYGFSADGKYTGWSSEGTGITPATGSGNAATIFGASPLINSFVLVPVVPEPTTIALGGLGAATLLYFRRRRK